MIMNWSLLVVASDLDNMGVLQKLGSFITELNIQPALESEKLKEDPGEGGSSYRPNQ